MSIPRQFETISISISKLLKDACDVVSKGSRTGQCNYMVVSKKFKDELDKLHKAIEKKRI